MRRSLTVRVGEKLRRPLIKFLDPIALSYGMAQRGATRSRRATKRRLNCRYRHKRWSRPMEIDITYHLSVKSSIITVYRRVWKGLSHTHRFYMPRWFRSSTDPHVSEFFNRELIEMYSTAVIISRWYSLYIDILLTMQRTVCYLI